MAPRKNNFGISGLLDTPMVPLDNEYYDRLSTQGLANQARRNEKVAAELQHLQNAENGGDNAASLVRMNQRKQAADANYDAAMQTIWPGRQTSQVNNAAAPQQNAPQPQRTTTGGGQAIAAENPDQQTAGNPQAPGGSTSTMENWSGTNVDVQRDPATGRAKYVNFGEAGSGPNTGWGKVVGQAANQQAAAGQSRPGLGLNGMRDLGNGQVAVGQVDGFQNPGYGFKGSREDAARFFQPVGRPGGYNPYKQRFRTLFDEQMDARRAAQNAPSPVEPQGPMGWKRLRDKMNNESRERIAEMTGGFGLTQAGMQDARAREQLAQQYGFNMAQLGNDNLRTQAALGLSGLQQQQAMQQMRQDAMLNNARYTLATADPNSDAYKRAERVVKALGGGQNGEGPKIKERSVTRDDGTEVKELYTDYGDGTWGPAQQRGTDGGANFADKLDSFEAGLPQNQKDALNELKKKDPNKYQTKRLELYAAANGVDYGA